MLFDMMLQKMKKLQPTLDVLFITGDFVGHFTNNDREDPYDPQKYTTLMQVHTNLSTMIQRHMSDVLVIPTFGNNDFDLDDEPANETAKAEFYSRIFKLWFEDHPTNSKKINLTAIRPTFMNGGYYRVDINPKLSVLALNTVMYLFKNKGMQY
jgi:predicted phosphodiesterase